MPESTDFKDYAFSELGLAVVNAPKEERDAALDEFLLRIPGGNPESKQSDAQRG